MLYEEGAEEWSSSIVREKSGEPEGRIDTDVDESQFRRPRTRSRSAFSVGQSRLEEDDEVAKKHPKIEVVSPVRHSTSSVTTGQDPPHVAARTGSPSAAKEPSVLPRLAAQILITFRFQYNRLGQAVCISTIHSSTTHSSSAYSSSAYSRRTRRKDSTGESDCPFSTHRDPSGYDDIGAPQDQRINPLARRRSKQCQYSSTFATSRHLSGFGRAICEDDIQRDKAVSSTPVRSTGELLQCGRGEASLARSVFEALILLASSRMLSYSSHHALILTCSWWCSSSNRDPKTKRRSINFWTRFRRGRI